MGRNTKKEKTGVELLVNIVPVMVEISCVRSLIVPDRLVTTFLFLMVNVVRFARQDALIRTDDSFQKEKPGTQLLVSIVLVMRERLFVP